MQPLGRPTASPARRTALRTSLDLLTAGAATKGALGGLACLALWGHPSWWTGDVPLAVHFLVIVCFVWGALRLRKDTLSYSYSAAILACVSAAYATRPLLESGIALARVRVEGLAPFLLWLLVMEAPAPLRSRFWRGAAIAGAAFCGVAAAWTFVKAAFVLLPRAWGPRYFQLWDLTIPLGLVALIVLFCRSLLARDELGLCYVFSLLPLVVMLTLEALLPGVAAFTEAHRPVFTGFLTASLMTLPVWLLRESRRVGSKDPRGERGGRAPQDARPGRESI